MSEATDASNGRRLLYTPEDDEQLSGLLCLTRKQIEVFATNPHDIAVRTRRGGDSRRLGVGRVGIRCIHCSHLPAEQRAERSVSYPMAIRFIHQAVRNWQRYHFDSCEMIPDEVKEQYHYRQVSGEYSRRSSADYWVQSCARIGLVDAKDGAGIYFASSGNEPGGNVANSVMGNKSSSGIDAKKKKDCSGAAAIVDVSMLTPISDLRCAGAGSATEVPELSPSRCPDLEITVDTGHGLDSIGANVSSSHDCGGPVVVDDNMREHAVSKYGGTHPLRIPETANKASDINSEPDNSRSEPMPWSEEADQSVPPERDGKKEYIVKQVRLAHELVKSSLEMKWVPPVQSAASGAAHCVPSNQEDLYSLGVDLYELFSGCHPFEGIEGGTAAQTDTSEKDQPLQDAPVKKREKKSVPERAFVPLRELGLPVSLCSLVSNLMGRKGNGHYQSAEEVKQDLLALVSNPERFLFDVDLKKVANGRLDFTNGKIYGREEHIRILTDAYNRVTESNDLCEVVLISGSSGTGKSTLVSYVQKPLSVRGAYFISGKFDELRQAQPLSAIVSALNEYCDLLLKGDEKCRSELSAGIKTAIGEDGQVLSSLIPNMCRIIGTPDNTSEETTRITGKAARNRMFFVFRKFFQAISRPSHPVVMFLDDLQWADETSLDLIHSLVANPEMTSLLFIGCYRDNEVGNDHPLTARIRSFESLGIRIRKLKVGNIDRRNVNTMVSDALYLLPRETLPLSTVVYNKTDGNVLFVVEFLRSLCDEGLLAFSVALRRWEWDLEAIESKNIADNVVQLMMSKMSNMSAEVLWALKVAACFGCQCEESILMLLDIGKVSDCRDFAHPLDIAVHEGLMCKTGTTYKFSHDQIQQAAYSLIHGEDPAALHLQIGRLLLQRASCEELHGMLFIVVDQLQRGSQLISSHDEKIKVANLFLMTGKKAITSSSFLPASVYFIQGICLLAESDWEDHYALILELHTCCIEAQYVIGNFDDLENILKPIYAHGKCFQDKFRAYLAQMNALAAQAKVLDAIKLGELVLSHFGEPFPDEASQSAVKEELTKTTGMLQQTSTDKILQQDVMQRKDMISAMQVLNHMLLYTNLAKQELTPMVALRMVQLTLCYGVCKESALAFAALGMILCEPVGDYRSAYSYGKLGMSLLAKFNANEYLARMYTVVFGVVNVYIEPFQACADSLKSAHKVGMSTGEIEWAMTCINVYAWFSVLGCCKNLEPIANELRLFTQQMLEFNQSTNLMHSLPYLQAVQNLLGPSEDPAELIGDVMNCDDLLCQAREQGKSTIESHVYFVRMWLSYLFGKYQVASEVLESLLLDSAAQSRALQIHKTFYIGLVASYLTRVKKQEKMRNVAYESLEKMKLYAEYSTWNCQNKLHLLNAEIAYLNGDLDEAATAYDDAIRTAGEHGFKNEKALAFERAAIFYSERAFSIEAAHYFGQAHQNYLDWGAKRKAEDLLEHLRPSENSLCTAAAAIACVCK